MSKSPETTDWSSIVDQQVWFDKFKSSGQSNSSLGMKFSQFQEFLKATVYTYFARLPASSSDTDQANNHGSSSAADNDDAKFTYQQEMQLFKMFDSKNDHLLDRDEFAHMCQNWLEKVYHRACALVVVDVQNDFIDGSLALIKGPAGQDGAEVVPVINKILETCQFEAVAYTQDWHPVDHIGFYDNLHLRKYCIKRNENNNKINGTTHNKSSTGSNNDEDSEQLAIEAVERAPTTPVGYYKFKKLNHTNAKVFDIVLFDEGKMEQKLWPVHCIQDSWGAQLHEKLLVVPEAIRVYKGTLSNVDAYSAFWDNMRLNETGLRQELTSRKINDVFFCGLALDYCVAASAIDAAKAGFITFVIADACRGIDEQEIRRRKEEMLDNGILIINSDTINSYLLQVSGCSASKGSLIGYDHINEEGRLSTPRKVLASGGGGSGVGQQSSSLSPSSCLPKFGSHFDRRLMINICYKRASILHNGGVLLN